MLIIDNACGMCLGEKKKKKKEKVTKLPRTQKKVTKWGCRGRSELELRCAPLPHVGMQGNFELPVGRSRTDRDETSLRSPKTHREQGPGREGAGFSFNQSKIDWCERSRILPLLRSGDVGSLGPKWESEEKARRSLEQPAGLTGWFAVRFDRGSQRARAADAQPIPDMTF